MAPQKKPLPANLSFQMQPQLLMKPETNPTGYVPFEHAADFGFDPGALEPSRVNAWWLADAAWLAYWHDADAAVNVLRDRAGLTARYIEKEGAEAYVASCPSFAIVTFRGTQPNDWSDIFDDACYKAEPWEGAHVHRGFARRLRNLDEVMGAFVKDLPSGCPVWFTGHSLGAAVASLAAYRYRAVAGGVYTFGSPLVGNDVFSSNFNAALKATSVRYVNHHDIVTVVPPPRFAWPNGEFTHVEHARVIDENGHIVALAPSAPAGIVSRVLAGAAAVVDEIETRALDVAKAVTMHRGLTMSDRLSDHTPLYYALHCWNDFVEHFDEER